MKASNSVDRSISALKTDGNIFNQLFVSKISNVEISSVERKSLPEVDLLKNAHIEVIKLKANKDSLGNLGLEVINKRSFGIASMDKGLFITSKGQTKEKVLNVHEGKPLKGNTVHSDWNRRRAPSDRHSLNISSVAKPSRIDSDGNLIGKLIQGKTTAQQAFVFKQDSMLETTFPRSGFQIEYKSEIFDSKGTKIESGEVEIPPGSDVYAILSIKKSPSNVTMDAVIVEKGTGEIIEAMWKVSRAPQIIGSELKWNIDLI